MHQIISDYINGNLTEAKRRAKNASTFKLLDALQEHYQSEETAVAVLRYLKGYGSFQAACDAERAVRS